MLIEAEPGEDGGEAGHELLVCSLVRWGLEVAKQACGVRAMLDVLRPQPIFGLRNPCRKTGCPKI